MQRYMQKSPFVMVAGPLAHVKCMMRLPQRYILYPIACCATGCTVTHTSVYVLKCARGTLAVATGLGNRVASKGFLKTKIISRSE